MPEKGKVLIVEDNDHSRELAGEVLEESGYAVAQAASGEAGLKILETFIPDVVLLDRGLPGISGDELMDFVKETPSLKGTKIIVISARSGVLDRVQGLALGADDYLPKPYDISELAARVQTQVRTKMAEDAVLRAYADVEKKVQERTRDLAESNEKLKKEISQRELAEAETRKREESFRNLVEGSIQGILIVRERRPLFVNAAYAHIFGYDHPEQVLALDSINPLISAHDRERVAEYELKRLRGEAVPTKYEYRGIRRDGQEIWLDNICTVINWEGRQAVLTTNFDITEKKRAEEELRKSEALLRNVVGNAPVILFALDQDGIITLTDGKGLDKLKLKPGEHTGQSYFKVFEQSPHLAAGVRRVLAGEPLHEVAEVDGVFFERWMEPLKGPSGEVLGLIGVSVDITERKIAEDALRAALHEIEGLKNRLQAENIYLQDEIKLTHNFEEIIGTSRTLQEVFHQVTQVAPTGATVLILGESGTGKELFARAIHDAGGRKDRPLVKVNCAALPAGMIETELFGHEKGAFTGAVARRIGRFELADGGTIFLDEIGELPLDLQSKLLRVLQEGEFERLGSSHTKRVDVRVIAATNSDLEKAVAERIFREDLFYRLSVFPIRIPPLRERQGDIPVLAKHFVRKYASKLGKSIEEISASALSSLTSYSWPGNVRELENVIERAVILTQGSRLQVEEQVTSTPRQNGPTDDLGAIREQERALILRTLEACGWVIGGKKGAANQLNLAASTLRERMQKFGLQRPG